VHVAGLRMLGDVPERFDHNPIHDRYLGGVEDVQWRLKIFVSSNAKVLFELIQAVAEMFGDTRTTFALENS
jgi:hypothetical protein